MEVVKYWKSKLQQVLSEYPREYQLNADKTGVFYGQILRKIMIQKGVKCKGKKLSKASLSVLFVVVLLVKY
jgi:hypothetical protein